MDKKNIIIILLSFIIVLLIILCFIFFKISDTENKNQTNNQNPVSNIDLSNVSNMNTSTVGFSSSTKSSSTSPRPKDEPKNQVVGPAPVNMSVEEEVKQINEKKNNIIK